VDAALVHHYFGSKDELFVAALALPVDPRGDHRDGGGSRGP
jgi:AcrR family transcriptional regulator